MVIAIVKDDPLDVFAGRIQKAHARICCNEVDWVEASLELATAMFAARAALAYNVAFGTWLVEHELDFYNKNDRAALVSLGENPALARRLLTDSKSICYQTIWQEHVKNEAGGPMLVPKIGTRKSTISSDGRIVRRRAPRLPGRAMLHRRAKLGDAMMDQIKGTSLDSAMELDELVRLNLGAAEGDHTDIVKQLVADAVGGKAVSAIAHAASLGAANYKEPNLILIWNKRMTACWEMSSSKQQHKLVELLMNQLKQDK